MVPTRNGISGDPEAALSRPHHCLKCISAISFTSGRFEGECYFHANTVCNNVGGRRPWEYKCLVCIGVP